MILAKSNSDLISMFTLTDSQPVFHAAKAFTLCSNCKAYKFQLYLPDEFQNVNSRGKICDSEIDLSEEEIVRLMLEKRYNSQNWLCDKCQTTMISSKLSIPELFSLLRFWSPQTQLQLPSIIQEILTRGGGINDRDFLTDMTMLHYTAKCGSLGDEDTCCKLAEFLLDSGADLESRTGWTDMTPLHYAAYFDCPILVKLFLNRGADIIARSDQHEGGTPLHLAASQLSVQTVKVILHWTTQNQPLLENAVVPSSSEYSLAFLRDIKDYRGRTPFDCLPTSQELPDNLASLRNRLAELLSRFTKLGRSHKHHKNGETQSAKIDSDPERILTAEEKLSAEFKMVKLRNIQGSRFSANTTVMNKEMTQNLLESKLQHPGFAETGILSPRIRNINVDCGLKNLSTSFYEFESSLTTPTKNKTSLQYQQVAAISAQSSPIVTKLQTTVNPVQRMSLKPYLSTNIADAQVAKVTLHSLGLHLGDKVCISTCSSAMSRKRSVGDLGSKLGYLRYCGPVEFASGIWAGVELEEPYGRNNGTVEKVQYFSCAEDHGIFAPIGRVYRHDDKQDSWCPVTSRKGSNGSGTQSPMATKQRSNSICNSPVKISHVQPKVDSGIRPRTLPDPDSIRLGDIVLVAGIRKGKVRFVGETEFAPGFWYGVELYKPQGKNDGSINGVRYFICPDKHGIFAPPTRIQKLPSDKDDSLSTSSTISSELKSVPTSRRQIRSAPLVTSLEKQCNKKPPFYLGLGMTILCAGEIGTVRFLGPVHFTDGVWIGVELRQPRGRHDGFVAGHRYFNCRSAHGILVRPARITCRGLNAASILPPDLVEIDIQAMRKLYEKQRAKTHSCASNQKTD